ALAGRRIAMPMALDLLPRFAGYWEVVGGILLIAGLFTRSAAVISGLVAIAAYLFEAVPRGGGPIRNGGNEGFVYALVFVYIAVRGAGAWSLDQLVGTARGRNRRQVGAAASGAVLRPK